MQLNLYGCERSLDDTEYFGIASGVTKHFAPANKFHFFESMLVDVICTPTSFVLK
jgi:hypothetical protein